MESPTRIGDEVTGHAVEVRAALECSGLDYGPIGVHETMKVMGPAGPAYPSSTLGSRPAPHRGSGSSATVLELLLPAGWTVLSAITAVFPPSRKSTFHRRPARGVRAAAHRVHSGALFGDRRREARMARERSLAASARHAWHRERSLAASEAVNDRFGAENGLTWR